MKQTEVDRFRFDIAQLNKNEKKLFLFKLINFLRILGGKL